MDGRIRAEGPGVAYPKTDMGERRPPGGVGVVRGKRPPVGGVCMGNAGYTERASSEGLAMWRPTIHKLVQVRPMSTCMPAMTMHTP